MGIVSLPRFHISPTENNYLASLKTADTVNVPGELTINKVQEHVNHDF